MIEIILIILAVSLFFFLVIIGWGIGSYNTFRVGQQDIKTQWSNILTEYQRRVDLLYNLVQAVKSHKKFEKETLVQVIKARGGNIAEAREGHFGKTKTAQMQSLRGLDNMFAGMRVVFERYPELQSHKQHDKLMEETRITEDRINVARTDYNEIVGDYNKLVTTFPKNIIAGIFRFTVELFYQNQQGTEIAPKIDLD